jgi:hypothetical protein
MVLPPCVRQSAPFPNSSPTLPQPCPNLAPTHETIGFAPYAVYAALSGLEFYAPNPASNPAPNPAPTLLPIFPV